MNVFRLSDDPKECAKFHCDGHVNKMVVESVQILQTALFLNGYDPDKLTYKPTHKHHPIVQWCRESLFNFFYVHALCYHLHDEWKFRYGHSEDRVHKSIESLEKLDLRVLTPYFPKHFGETEQPKAMPDEISERYDDVVEAYRAFYVLDKVSFAEWKRGREKPRWFTEKEVTFQ